MKSSQRLQPVQRFTEMKENQAAKALGDFIKKFETQKKRLADLDQYRRDYHQRFQETARQGISVAKLQDFRSFMANLDKAIEQQQLVVRQMEVEFEAKKRQWLAAHNRTQAIDTVINHHVEREQLIEEKKTQREIDDRSIKKVT